MASDIAFGKWITNDEDFQTTYYNEKIGSYGRAREVEMPLNGFIILCVSPKSINASMLK